MADRDLKYLSIKSIIIIIVCLIDKISALSICSSTVWALNATTIAGSPTGIAGFNSTLLNQPIGIMVGKNDSIYVMDYSSPYYRMQLFYPSSQLGTIIINTTSGIGLNQFSIVNAVNIDIRGNIYILDAGNYRVTKWVPGASTGIVVVGANRSVNSLNQLSFPFDFFVEPNTSYIWIADYYNCRIVKWLNSSTGILITGAGCGTQANEFNGPTGLFVDTSDSNTLYVADCWNHRIQKWHYGASSGTTVAGQSSGVSGSALNQLYKPYTFTVDTHKSLYIMDNGNNRIVLWLVGSTSGILIAGSGIAGTLPSQLNNPYSIRLDSTGAVIVADYGNNRIQRFPVLCSPNMSPLSSSSAASILVTIRMIQQWLFYIVLIVLQYQQVSRKLFGTNK
ncbi:unnamed protein product [Adineta steineri]|uniref:NHL repeat containing protein-like protein n=1 Tax=Adineta steineri TaxID=433720 RepID=A0A815LDC4_9BILA|nr:unnamed protein product [Adineta steineri]CAF3713216.1 unnamed protein product [Adineta steineri]